MEPKIQLKDVPSLVKQTFKEWSEDKASRLAAALSYYTVFSLAPLLVIVIAIAGLVFRNAQDQIMGQIRAAMGTSGEAAIGGLLQNAARNPSGSIFATIIGVVTLLFGASGVFGQLQDALNTIWEVQAAPGRGFLATIKDRFFSFTMVLGMGFLLLVSMVVSAALAAFGRSLSNLMPGMNLLVQVLNIVVGFAVITLLFGLVFKVVPDVKIRWKDVLIGAVVTSLLFTLGRLVLQIYLSNVSSSYGAAGSLVVVLLWVYYSAQILFLGAEFTQVYANRFGVHLEPERGAVMMSDEVRANQGLKRTSPADESVHPAAGTAHEKPPRTELSHQVRPLRPTPAVQSENALAARSAELKAAKAELRGPIPVTSSNVTRIQRKKESGGFAKKAGAAAGSVLLAFGLKQLDKRTDESRKKKKRQDEPKRKQRR